MRKNKNQDCKTENKENCQQRITARTKGESNKKIFEMDLRNVIKYEAEIRFLSFTKNKIEYDIKRTKCKFFETISMPMLKNSISKKKIK